MNSGNPNLVSFAAELLLTLLSVTILMRILLQWVRADFYNPVCQVIIKSTDPVLKPVKRVLRPLGRIDTASLAVYLLLVGVTVALWDPRANDWLAIIQLTLMRAILTVLTLYTLLIFLGAILSWAHHGIRHPLIPLIHQLNAPILKPFRKYILPIGGIDFSPLFAILAIQLLKRLIGL
jgi:YggT family protein